jgi:hypothetical protein
MNLILSNVEESIMIVSEEGPTQGAVSVAKRKFDMLFVRGDGVILVRRLRPFFLWNTCLTVLYRCPHLLDLDKMFLFRITRYKNAMPIYFSASSYPISMCTGYLHIINTTFFQQTASPYYPINYTSMTYGMHIVSGDRG